MTIEESDLRNLRFQVSKLKRELRNTYEALEGMRQLLELGRARLWEAEKLLSPSRFTNAKVRDHFHKWSDVDGDLAQWGGVDGRPESSN